VANTYGDYGVELLGNSNVERRLFTDLPVAKQCQSTDSDTGILVFLSFRDHVKPALAKLHRLPVKFRILYKLCLFMHHVHYKSAPKYLSDSGQSVVPQPVAIVELVCVLPTLPTMYSDYFGERGFSFAGPAAWNNLPNDLQHCSNTDEFKNKLKTFLFQRAFYTD